jgi:phosphatidylserine/phosphatidylglycerophosphate/cardiolipin synthase-like enzyme
MSSIKPYGTKSLSTGDIKIYFNDVLNNSVSTGQNAMQLFQAIDDTLIAYIDRADKTLDLTIYDFDNAAISNISTAINAAKQRGVKVRFISDGSQAATNLGVNQLNASVPKITSPTTGAYNIMHNKFVIIDAKHSNPNKSIVWSGSTNWTDRQINRDPNSVVIVQDQTLAKAYTLEFEEMWGDTGATPNIANSKFGPFKTDNTPHEFNINNKRLECYFSPSDGTNSFLLNTINSADNNIYFASMLITRADIAAALNSEQTQGTIVKGLINVTTSTGSVWPTLLGFMGPSNLRSNQDSVNTIMHHKYMIVDENQTSNDPLIWVGSHNWTTAANNKNDENTMVIHDASITNQYFQEFSQRFVENGGLLLNLKNNETSTIKSFPTIVNKLSEVQFYINDDSNLSIAVYSASGALVYQENMGRINSGFYQLNNQSKLGAGMYFINFTTNGKTFTKKIVIE